MSEKYHEPSGLRRQKNASDATGTKLTRPKQVSQSGLCSVCTKDAICEVGKKAKTGRPLFPEPFGTGQFGAEKRMPNLEDIQILPELYGESINFKKVNTETTLGGFKVKVPLVIAAMGSTNVAHYKGYELAAGAAKAGIVCVVGENMLQTHGKEGVLKRVQPFLDNYDGYGAMIVQGNIIDIKQGIFEFGKELGAHGIEIKLGQGAKQCMGGEIHFKDEEQAKKYKELGYEVIKCEDGYERHTPPGGLNKEDLKQTISKYKGLGLPIWIKIGAGKGLLQLVKDLIEIKNELGQPQCLTIDGFGGGTGMSPWLIMNEMNVPSAYYLQEIMKMNPNFDIVIAGGYIDGADVAKGMMMGAKGVAMGRPFLIATAIGDKGVANFANAIKEELQMISSTLRKDDASKIIGLRDNLVALSSDAAKRFGLKEKPF